MQYSQESMSVPRSASQLVRRWARLAPKLAALSTPASESQSVHRWARRATSCVLAGDRLADRELPALEHLLMEAPDRLVRLGLLGHIHERKPARSARLAIEWNADLSHGADLSEEPAQIRFRHVVREIANKQTDRHPASFSATRRDW